MELTENQKAWLGTIYDEAIHEHRRIAKYENGQADYTDAPVCKLHRASAKEHDQFADWLEEQKDNAEATL